MGAAGRERVEREFTVDRVVQAYEALYSELTGSRTPI
jgi:glycosyltransferase involved in cell wall biosynthesis